MDESEKEKGWKLWNKGDERWFWLLLSLAPLFLLFAIEFTTRVSPVNMLWWMGDEAGAVLANYLALLCLMTVATVATKRLWIGILIPSIPAAILCIVNYLKLSVNGVGLVISDLAMAGHAGTLMEFVPRRLRLPAWGVVGALLLVGAVVGARIFAQELPEKLRGKRRRGIAALGAVAVLAVTLLAPWFYYIGPKEESQAERDERLGLLVGLYGGALRSTRIMNAPPEDLEPVDPSEMVETVSEPSFFPDLTVKTETKPTTVIMLMSESFCDPSLVLPGVRFEGDPVKNFHALEKAWPSGSFLSNSYAGGTGNVEMEVFTGIPSALLSERETLTTLSAEGAYSNAPSIVKAFVNAGYHTRFIHTYTDRLYNRRNNLAEIGFESLTFQEDLREDPEMAGPYLSDMELTRAVMDALESKGDGEKLFLYALSMGNHQPIFAEKYSEPSGFEPSSELLDEDDLGSLDALAQGLHNADEALGALVEYLEDHDEPVLLVFWGDHLPGLYSTPDHSVFSALGYVPTADTMQWDAATIKMMCTTQFFVWNNYDAKLEVPEEVGNNQLGSLTLDWAGVEKPAYFQWVDKAGADMLIYRSRLFVDGEGVAHSQPTEKGEEVLRKYQQLLYNVLYAQGGQE